LGEIRGSTVVIDELGRVTGGIVAEEVVVSGVVLGSIWGKRVLLRASSHVEGDVFHGSLLIEEGASFQGQASYHADDPRADAVLSAVGYSPRRDGDIETAPINSPLPGALHRSYHRRREVGCLSWLH
jgi:cytoskeletal protein CcmA (bactofilin family)